MIVMRRGKRGRGEGKEGEARGLMTEQSRIIHREEIITASAKMCIFHSLRVILSIYFSSHMQTAVLKDSASLEKKLTTKNHCK